MHLSTYDQRLVACEGAAFSDCGLLLLSNKRIVRYQRKFVGGRGDLEAG
jgi:hypothetical protein